MASKGKKSFRHSLFLLAPLVALVILAGIFIAQEQKLTQIKQEQTVNEEALLALQNEAQRLERMIEYAKTEEYLLQYAREMLGYVMPDDVRFHMDNQ